jgi:hypothetical protein
MRKGWGWGKTNVSSCCSRIALCEGQLPTQVSSENTYHFWAEIHTQILSDDPCRHVAVWEKAHLATYQRAANERLRTLYNFRQINFQIVHSAQRLRDCCPNFILGQSIQPLKHTLDLIVSKNLLCIRPCRTLSYLE